MKQLILEKNEIYKKYVNKNKEPKIFEKAKCLRNDQDSIIESNKKILLPLIKKVGWSNDQDEILLVNSENGFK